MTGDGLLGSVCHSLGLREVGFFGLVYTRPEDEQEVQLVFCTCQGCHVMLLTGMAGFEQAG